MDPLHQELARKFHEAYERLAPKFGYETREDTKDFDTETPNGKLMVAVMEEMFPLHAGNPDLVDQTMAELANFLAHAVFNIRPDFYVIWSNKEKAWIQPAYMGYTKNKREAGVFDKEDAYAIVQQENEGQSDEEVPNTTIVPVVIDFGDGGDNGGGGDDETDIPPKPRGGAAVRAPKEKAKPIKSPQEFMPKQFVAQGQERSFKILRICLKKQ